MSRRSSCGWAVALMASFPALAFANPMAGLEIGRAVGSSASVGAAMRLQGAQIWSSSSPQALRKGLVATGLLEAINRARVAPRGAEGGLDPRAIEQLGVGARGSVRYAFALSSGRIRFVLARVPVTVDPSRDTPQGWSRTRLHGLQDVLTDLAAFRLRVEDRDKYGNRFEWRGRRSADRVWVRYRPELDEVWILLHG